MNRHRAWHFLVALVAVGVMATAVASCSSNGDSKADLAAQDHAVATANKIEKQNLAKLKAALAKKWQARARARAAAARRRAAARRTVIVGSERVSAGNICAPITSSTGGRAGRAERRLRRLQRRRALAYLNLHCPSLNVPRV